MCRMKKCSAFESLALFAILSDLRLNPLPPAEHAQHDDHYGGAPDDEPHERVGIIHAGQGLIEVHAE